MPVVKSRRSTFRDGLELQRTSILDGFAGGRYIGRELIAVQSVLRGF